MQLWEYAENCANRREVIDKLLRVDGVSWNNFHNRVDTDHVVECLDPDPVVDNISMDRIPSLLEACPDDRLDEDNIRRAQNGEINLDENPWKALSYTGLAERHYSLTRRQNRGVLNRVSRDLLEEESRYILDTERYDTVAEALDDVDYTVGWDRMQEIRASHNDATFIDEFLTEEFVTEHNYFAYEYSHTNESYHVSSTDVADIKRKLLLELTNFGKPTIVACDDNFRNRGELLLVHEYNGVMLDMDEAEETLKRLFELYGRPVNLLTVGKNFESETDDEVQAGRSGYIVAQADFRPDNEPTIDEIPRIMMYDGDKITYEEPSGELRDLVMDTMINYDTRPEEWFDD